jgi:hypothetical protein
MKMVLSTLMLTGSGKSHKESGPAGSILPVFADEWSSWKKGDINLLSS